MLRHSLASWALVPVLIGLTAAQVVANQSPWEPEMGGVRSVLRVLAAKVHSIHLEGHASLKESAPRRASVFAVLDAISSSCPHDVTYSIAHEKASGYLQAHWRNIWHSRCGSREPPAPLEGISAAARGIDRSRGMLVIFTDGSMFDKDTDVKGALESRILRLMHSTVNYVVVVGPFAAPLDVLGLVGAQGDWVPQVTSSDLPGSTPRLGLSAFRRDPLCALYVPDPSGLTRTVHIKAGEADEIVAARVCEAASCNTPLADLAKTLQPHREMCSVFIPSNLTSRERCREVLQSRHSRVMLDAGDMQEHADQLRRLARRCSSVTEFGVRAGVSTLSLLLGEPRVYRGYDIKLTPEVKQVEAELVMAGCFRNRGNFQLLEQSTSDERLRIQPTDLLMIDSLHTPDQLWRELVQHSPMAKRYIVLHDTTSCGGALTHEYVWSELCGGYVGDGLWPEVERFVEQSGGVWIIQARYFNSAGLTILARTSVWTPETLR